MAFSTAELAQARQAVDDILKRLGVEAYLFEVEPLDGQWQIRIECAVQTGWEMIHFSEDATQLLQSADDDTVREGLAARWGERLAACRRGN